MPPPVLSGTRPRVDRRRLGISYSGGGSLFLVELGIAKAFIARGVVPDFIAGASSGALAAVAHALDPHGGRGVDVSARVLGGVNDGTFGLRWWQVALRLAFGPRTSVGDNQAVKTLMLAALCREFGIEHPTVGMFSRPEVRIGAADRLSGEPVWFPPETPLGDALVASTAIPGLFPWVELEVRGRRLILVDGGIVVNQPLSELVDLGCGTIFAAMVGPVGGQIRPPTDLLNNATGSVYLAIHQSARLEEAYVGELIRSQGVILHVHPVVDFPIKRFNFTPRLVRQVIEESARRTEEWLIQNGY